MAYTTQASLILLALTLAKPRPTLDSILWPLDLLRPPPAGIALRPNLVIAKAVEYLAASWAALAVLDSGCRTIARLARRTRGGDRGGMVKGLKSKEILGIRPVLMLVVWHVLAWRLIVWPKGAQDVMRFTRGIEPSALIGVVGGLIASWGEMGRLLALFGWNKGELNSPPVYEYPRRGRNQLIRKDPQTGPSWTLSITHVVLSIHRLVLGVRILSAGISATGLVGGQA